MGVSKLSVFTGSLKALIISGAAVMSGSAFAADLLPPPAPMEPPPAMAAEFSGWYIRGDVGMGQNRVRKSSVRHSILASSSTAFNTIRGQSHHI